MYALIENGSITKHLNGNRGIQVGDIKYSKDIYSKWTEAERNAIGIFEIIFDNTNKKNKDYYVNTAQTYTYDADAGTVTATYGDATARAHADANATDADGADLDPVVVIPGLKTKFIKNIKLQASGLLLETDWYVIRKTEKNTAIPDNVTTWRNGIRTKQAGDPVVMARPLGEFPVLGS